MTGEQIRYGELSTKVEFLFLQSFLNLSCLQKVEVLACALTQRGFGEGDVIAVLLPNCIQVQTCSACTTCAGLKNIMLTLLPSQFSSQYPVVVLAAAAAQCVVSPMNSG